MLKCCYVIFWMYGSKNILFLLPLFEKRKSHTFSIFSYPGSRKVLTSAKIRIPSQKCCRHFHLMQDCLKYLCAQFGSDSTKNKEMVKGGGGREWSNALPSCYPTYLTSKKPNSCRVKQLGKPQNLQIGNKEMDSLWMSLQILSNLYTTSWICLK